MKSDRYSNTLFSVLQVWHKSMHISPYLCDFPNHCILQDDPHNWLYNWYRTFKLHGGSLDLKKSLHTHLVYINHSLKNHLFQFLQKKTPEIALQWYYTILSINHGSLYHFKGHISETFSQWKQPVKSSLRTKCCL